MTAPLTVPTPPSASSGVDTNFSERLQFGTVFYGLSQKGINLSEEEKKRFEQITRESLNQHDNSVMSGLGLSNVLYLLFAFIGNLFGGKGTTDLSHFGDQVASSNGQAVEMSKLRQLEMASTDIYRRLKAEGGNLAAAAEYATYVAPMGEQTQYMAGSIYEQLRADIKLPEGASSSLASLDPRRQTNLPSPPSTQPLTRRG